MSLQLLFCLKNNLRNPTGIDFGYINRQQCPDDSIAFLFCVGHYIWSLVVLRFMRNLTHQSFSKRWYCSRAGVTNYDPGSLIIFVNKTLLEHSHAHSCVTAFATTAELSNWDRPYGLQNQSMYLLSDLLQKVFANSCS